MPDILIIQQENMNGNILSFTTTNINNKINFSYNIIDSNKSNASESCFVVLTT